MTGISGEIRLPDFAAAVEDGLRRAAELVLAAAKEGAPVLTGKLRDSGASAVEGLTAAVGFTDSKAVAAHENMHDRLRNGKRAKFLELAAQENADAAMKLIGDALLRSLT